MFIWNVSFTLSSSFRSLSTRRMKRKCFETKEIFVRDGIGRQWRQFVIAWMKFPHCLLIINTARPWKSRNKTLADHNSNDNSRRSFTRVYINLSVWRKDNHNKSKMAFHSTINQKIYYRKLLVSLNIFGVFSRFLVGVAHFSKDFFFIYSREDVWAENRK